MKHILIFGASGFLGGCLSREALATGWQVTAITHTPDFVPFAVGCQACDIGDPEQVERLLANTRPDVIANLAAAANIDRAEADHENAFRVNAAGPEILARACRRDGIRLVHFSSDAVFDGTRAAYTENDLPNPLNYYGYTKIRGDEAVLREDPTAAILRISLALGFPVSRGNSFLAMLRTRFAEGSEVYSPEDEVRTPVDIHTLCAVTLEVASGKENGLFNIGCTQSVDRYTLTSRLARELGYPESLVRRGGVPLPGRARRHRNGTLDVSRAQNVFTTPLLNLETTIARSVL